MIQGFKGNASYAYLSGSEIDIIQAGDVHTRNAHGVQIRNEHIPFLPEEARGGGFYTGANNMSNIVADEDEYDHLARTVIEIDELTNNVIYVVDRGMEEMHRTSFVLPKSVRAYDNLRGVVREKISHNNMTAHEKVSIFFKYAMAIVGIPERGSLGNADFAWNTGSAEDVRSRVEEAKRRQISYMEDTVNAHRQEIVRLEAEAAHQDYIAANAMMTVTETDENGRTRRVQVPDTARRAAAARKAAMLRAKIEVLEGAVKNLLYGIDDLDRAITRKNQLFRRLQDEIYQTDRSYSSQLRYLEDGIRRLTADIQSLSNGIKSR